MQMSFFRLIYKQIRLILAAPHITGWQCPRNCITETRVSNINSINPLKIKQSLKKSCCRFSY